MSSYWLEEPIPPIPLRALDGPPDVAVVGGGVTGWRVRSRSRRPTCACACTRRGRSPAASRRNGGFALRSGAAPYDVMVESIGRERARALWQQTERSLDRLESLAGDAFRPSGSLRLAGDEEERAELRVEFELLREDGFAVEWIDDLAPPLAGRFSAGMWHPPDGLLQPARWVRRLAMMAAEAGAEIHEGSCVASLGELDAGQVVVETAGRCVLEAARSGTSQLVSWNPWRLGGWRLFLKAKRYARSHEATHKTQRAAPSD